MYIAGLLVFNSEVYVPAVISTFTHGPVREEISTRTTFNLSGRNYFAAGGYLTGLTVRWVKEAGVAGLHAAIAVNGGLDSGSSAGRITRLVGAPAA